MSNSVIHSFLEATHWIANHSNATALVLETLSSYSPSGNVELLKLLIASLVNSLLLYAVTMTQMRGLFMATPHNNIITNFHCISYYNFNATMKYDGGGTIFLGNNCLCPACQ